MMFSPAHTFPLLTVACENGPPPRPRSNLAPVNTRYRGHLLFLETPDNIGAHFTDPNEPGAASSPGSGRARRQNRRSFAESRPSLFSEVNHVTHFSFSRSSSRKREHRRSAFQHAGKIIHDSHRS